MTNFKWRTHQENVMILGMQGSGKTSLARRLLRTIPTVPRVIWSPQMPMQNYGAFGEPVRDIERIAQFPRAAHVWVGEFGPRQFAAICDTMMSRAQNALLVVDDVHEQVSKQRVPPEFARLVNSGRNRGITSIWITPAPNLVSNNLLQSAHHIFAFPFALEGQVEWLAKNRLGPDAYALLPRQLRRRRPAIGADYDELPPHSYIYHYHASSRAQLHVEGGGPDAEAAPGQEV